MKRSGAEGGEQATGNAWGTAARVQPALLTALGLAAGIGAGVYWTSTFTKPTSPASAPAGSLQESGFLSPGTRAVLGRLEGPLEIRYYRVLDGAGVSPALLTLASKLDRLLSGYEQAGQGKVKIVRSDSRSDTRVPGALADGLRPFNLDKGEPCYLGAVVLYQGRKEALPWLSPEWEAALEADLSRLIERVVTAPAAERVDSNAPIVDVGVLEEVKRSLPNFRTLPLEEGNRLLREKALREVGDAVSALEPEIRAVEDRIRKAQGDALSPDLEAATKELERLRRAQADRLQQIAAKSLAQIEALRRLKAAGP